MKKTRKALLLPFLLPGLLLLFRALAFAEDGQAGNKEALEQKVDRLEQEFEALKLDYEKVMQELKEKEATQKYQDRKGAPQQLAPAGGYGGIMNPNISVVADIQALFSNNPLDPNRNKIRVKEVELAFQGYLYPGIRADIIPAFEMVYLEDGEVTLEVDLEEAYITFSQFPYISRYVPLTLQGGRKLMNFGLLNPIHPHHWPFADTPLMLVNLFGEHPWYDDGVQVSVKIPNPLDVYLKTTFGYWNGMNLGHDHGDDGHDHAHGSADPAVVVPEPVDWRGNVFLSRSVIGFPIGDRLNTLMGYTITWDEGFYTVLHEADLTLKLRFPGTFRRIKWQNAFFAADMGVGGYTRYGGYSLLVADLSKNWQAGGRYDQAQVLNPGVTGDELAGSGFLTYYFTHGLYLRGQYRYRKTVENREEHNGYIQLVFGLGPHSHRLED